MNIVIVGPPSSGKGTQAEKLIEKFNLAHVNMGEILRKIKDQDTPLARKSMEYYNKGLLVPDEIIIELINKYLKGIGKLDGIVFDGFPRMITQAQYFENFLTKEGKKIDLVVFLNVSEGVILTRIAGRRICEKCSQVYNILTQKPKTEGICDLCGGKLVTRTDETPEAIRNRLNEFKTKVLPMINYFRQKGILEEVDGNRPIEPIFEDIVGRLVKRGLATDGQDLP